MKIIFRVEHHGAIGVIESPVEIKSAQPLAEQLIVKIGFDPAASRLDADEFDTQARLVVLELRSYIRAELD